MDKKLLDLLAECRPLFVAETVDPCYTPSGRERSRRTLQELNDCLAAATPTDDIAVEAVCLSSYRDGTPKGRGLAKRIIAAPGSRVPRRLPGAAIMLPVGKCCR